MYVWFGEVLVCLVFEAVSLLEFAVTVILPPRSPPPTHTPQITGVLHPPNKVIITDPSISYL